MGLLQELRDAFSSPGQALLHASFILLILSMAMRKMSTLRMLAIASGLTAIAFRIFVLYDPVSVLWNSLFVGVNLIQLAILWAERFRRRLSDDAEYFIATVIPDVHRSKARKLVGAGDWVVVSEGTQLTTSGTVVPHLMFVVDGCVQILKDGQQVAVCSKGDFVGEMSLITGEPASADAVAQTEVRYLELSQQTIQRIVRADHELRSALQNSFNRALVDKIIKSNQRVGFAQTPEAAE